jgi:hypothetical protein
VFALQEGVPFSAPVLRHKATGKPRLIASARANAMLLVKLSMLSLRPLRSIRLRIDGAASPTRMAEIAITTMASTRVKPPSLRRGAPGIGFDE